MGIPKNEISDETLTLSLRAAPDASAPAGQRPPRARPTGARHVTPPPPGPRRPAGPVAGPLGPRLRARAAPPGAALPSPELLVEETWLEASAAGGRG